MSQPAQHDGPLLISYLTLRKAVGILGVSLPFLVALGNVLIFHCYKIEDSISYYYHTHMRGVFVGTLWAIGVFLLSYRGYQTKDLVAGRLACIFAIVVSLFPTARAGQATCHPLNLLKLDTGGCDTEHIISIVHATAAASLFLTFAYFSLFLFTETHPGKKAEMTQRKRERNGIYYACGGIIVAAIAGILIVCEWLQIDRLGQIPTLFSFESIAVVAFGVSWLVKGEFVLKDQ